ncbi:hypothetical protein AMTR_s00311p00012650 [Amborella trichopoda]|uniref:Uncharacterized protein n=1 Tax=Amborella trichopoda TaxID=13333 RepID=U5D2F4_AMBTC|nr:hypothetical protein AMTR_s00311p00012650 [Amborella trichopoda]
MDQVAPRSSVISYDCAPFSLDWSIPEPFIPKSLIRSPDRSNRASCIARRAKRGWPPPFD